VTATRRNVEFAKRIGNDRVGNDYVYGGNWNPFDTSVGTDCSGCVIDICDAVRNGTAMAWTRHGMSTESWRPIEVGQTGTIFNTTCVAHPNDFPPDAVVKIAIHHGPGGGANSHMWCEVDGVRFAHPAGRVQRPAEHHHRAVPAGGGVGGDRDCVAQVAWAVGVGDVGGALRTGEHDGLGA